MKRIVRSSRAPAWRRGRYVEGCPAHDERREAVVFESQTVHFCLRVEDNGLPVSAHASEQPPHIGRGDMRGLAMTSPESK